MKTIRNSSRKLVLTLILATISIKCAAMPTTKTSPEAQKQFKCFDAYQIEKMEHFDKINNFKMLKKNILINNPSILENMLNNQEFQVELISDHDLARMVTDTLENNQLKMAKILLLNKHIEKVFRTYQDGYYLIIAVWDAAIKSNYKAIKILLNDKQRFYSFMTRDNGENAKEMHNLVQRNCTKKITKKIMKILDNCTHQDIKRIQKNLSAKGKVRFNEIKQLNQSLETVPLFKIKEIKNKGRRSFDDLVSN